MVVIEYPASGSGFMVREKGSSSRLHGSLARGHPGNVLDICGDSRYMNETNQLQARVAELVDALALGASDLGS